MRRILLSLALVAMAATAANADTYVWWDLVGSNCEAVKVSGGTQGSTLVIEKPLVAPAGYYEFEFVMRMSNTIAASTQGLTGFGTNLFKDLADADAAAISAMSWVNGNPLSWGGTTSGALNGLNGKILDNTGRKRSGSQQPLYAGNSPKDWITFVLRINVPTEEYCDWHYFYQSVGDALYAQAPPGAHNVFFGPNASVLGATAVNTVPAHPPTLPVIAIHAVPEPATLALLGFGFLALIRRR